MNATPQQRLERSVGGFRWSLLPHLQTQLLNEQGLRLPEWLTSGQARIVKQGPHRRVYKVELPGLSFYIKHNLIHDQRTWWRHLIRPSKARVEFDPARAAAGRGIPTIYPIAWAEENTRIGSGESILITQSLENCTPLHIFLAAVLPTYPEPRATRLRQHLADGAGQLVARIHHAGILHHDLHAANLLVRVGEQDQVQLFVIDLLAVKMGEPLDWAKSRQNLIMINCWFTLRVNRADRLRFWKAYFHARQLGNWKPDKYGTKLYTQGLREIEEMSWQRNIRFWQRRDKRCLWNCRYYRRVSAPGVVGYAGSEVQSEHLTDLLKDPDAPFRQPGVRILKESISSTVVEMEFPINGQMRPVIYKRFR